MRLGSESKDIQQQRFVVARPSVWQKAAFGFPGVSHGGAAVLRPLPINALIEGLGQPSEFALFRTGAVKVGGARQRASEENRRVDRRELTVPRAPARANIHKVIVETPMAGDIRFRSLLALVEEPQCRQRAFDRCAA